MDPAQLSLFVAQYFCLVLSLCVHEAAHALVADRCGDPTARLLGRVTLNPVKHVDPIGTVLMPILMFFTQIPLLFGWARPVPYNPRNLHNIRRDPVLIALAGPFSNLIIAVLTVLLLRIGFIVAGIDWMVQYSLLDIGLLLISINIVLMLFNMIPVPPLDGSALLGLVLPESGRQALDSIGPFGILIAIFIASRFLSGPINFLHGLVGQALTWGIPVA